MCKRDWSSQNNDWQIRIRELPIFPTAAVCIMDVQAFEAQFNEAPTAKRIGYKDINGNQYPDSIEEAFFLGDPIEAGDEVYIMCYRWYVL